MGLFRWMGGKLAAPITLRKHAYQDLREGVSSGARAARRGFRLRARAEPPIIPGTSEQDVEAVYLRWAHLNSGQRKTAWREFDSIMRILMKQEAEATGARWSLEMPESDRPEHYRIANARARKAIWIYAALMSIPIGLIPWNGGQPIYWLNLLAAGIILSPNVLRHLIVRAQVFHGGKVNIRQVFQSYPKELPASQLNRERDDAGAAPQAHDDMVRSGSFPMLAWLYGIKPQSSDGGDA